MNVISYTSEAKEQEKYLALVESHYGHYRSFPLHAADLESLASADHPTCRYQRRISFAVEDGGKFAAHCTIMIDRREQPGIGWFGFFECPHDRTVFDALWQNVLEEGRSIGIKLLRGPINGTIWYPYRFALPGASPILLFQGELLCEDYYHGFFHDLSEKEVSYYSAMRENFDDLIRITQPFYESLLADSSLCLESHITVTEDVLREVFALSREVFQSSWGFVPLSDIELFSYYSQAKLCTTLFRTYTLRQKDALIGFGTVFRENDDTLILKTLALDARFQGKGLGNALLHRIHEDAKNHCSRMIYALIRYENNVKRLPKDGAVVFREYGAFEIPVQ